VHLAIDGNHLLAGGDVGVSAAKGQLLSGDVSKARGPVFSLSARK
jgi:hypothetical protein